MYAICSIKKSSIESMVSVLWSVVEYLRSGSGGVRWLALNVCVSKQFVCYVVFTQCMNISFSCLLLENLLFVVNRRADDRHGFAIGSKCPIIWSSMLTIATIELISIRNLHSKQTFHRKNVTQFLANNCLLSDWVPE